MKLRRLFGLAVTHLRGAPVGALFATFGVATGVGFLVLFIGVGEGLRSRVLNEMFPANRVEFEPRRVKLFGVESSPGGDGLSVRQVNALNRVDGVQRALGKQRSAFPAKLWGGAHLLGFDLRSEAFFDGLPESLMRDELRRTEAKNREIADVAERCDVDEDCPSGSSCDDGLCAAVQWHERFHGRGVVRRCAADKDCLETELCFDGRCQRACAAEKPCPQRSQCTQGRCIRPCAAAQDCAPYEVCAGEPKTCQPIPCRLSDQAAARQVSSRARGLTTTSCSAGRCVTDQPCPHGSYCAPGSPSTLDGFCEVPVPCVVNPLLMEVFNSDMADSLNLPRVADPQLLYGQRFHLAFGDSHFTQDAALSRQQVKQAVVVGFSALAPELGVALPLDVVRHHNRRIRGDATLFDAVWVETGRNERTAAVIQEAESMGLSLTRRSRFARTLGRAVFVLYAAMVALGLLVLAVSASNITQTLAMLVHERRRELAILRALGGASWDVATLVIAQGLVLGAVGSTLGVVVALGVTELLEQAVVWLNIPLVPHDLVSYPPWLIPGAVATGLGFCLFGALLPARRAVRLDPSAVLSQP